VRVRIESVSVQRRRIDLGLVALLSSVAPLAPPLTKTRDGSSRPARSARPTAPPPAPGRPAPGRPAPGRSGSRKAGAKSSSPRKPGSKRRG
jgi:hypothetical protein